MSKICIMTKFVLLVTILILSTTFAKPASDENSSSEEAKNPIIKIVNNCRSEFEKNKPSSEKDADTSGLSGFNGCYMRCVFDGLGIMKNNTIDEKEISKSLDIFIILDPTDEVANRKVNEIFTDCAKETNLKQYEDKCEPIKELVKCIDGKKDEFSKIKKTEAA